MASFENSKKSHYWLIFIEVNVKIQFDNLSAEFLQEFLTVLAKFGADIDVLNEAGETPLRASLLGREEVFCHVHKCILGLWDNDVNVLNRIVFQTIAAVMKTLLDLRADPNATAADGRTTLHAAAASGNILAVKEMSLAKSIEMERRQVVAVRDGDEVGLTAFLLACDGGDREAAAAIAFFSPLCGHACTDRLESGAHLLARCSTVRGVIVVAHSITSLDRENPTQEILCQTNTM